MTIAFTTSVPLLISQQFDSEVVLANYQTGVYYNMDGTAAQIWLGIRQGQSPSDIAAAMAQVTVGDPAHIGAEVQVFIDAMLAEGLILAGPAEPRAADWLPVLQDGYATPSFERFDNLRELLLMDPVHDAGDQGWPLR